MNNSSPAHDSATAHPGPNDRPTVRLKPKAEARAIEVDDGHETPSPED